MSEAEGSKDNRDDMLISTRTRNPQFTKGEVQTLLNLVDKYKFIIQNKSTTSKVNQLKDNVWEKISKLYNKEGFEYKRTAECLKTKWDNLKKALKKATNNFLDTEAVQYNYVYNQVISIITQTEDYPDACENISESEEEKNEQVDVVSGDESIELDNRNTEKELKRRSRSSTFTQEEVKALLSLIEKYKSIILHKGISTVIVQTKEAAWRKLCKEFNKQGFKNVRSVISLKSKWQNLRREANRVSKDKDYEDIDDAITHTISLISQVKEETDNGKLSDTGEDINNQEDESTGDELLDLLDDNESSYNSDGENESKKKIRSHPFKDEEVKMLLTSIEKYKLIILNKCNSVIANNRKEAAWRRICKEYNKQGFDIFRSVDCLKGKWSNLEWEAKRLTDSGDCEGMDDIMSNVVSLVTQIKEYRLSEEKILGSEYGRNDGANKPKRCLRSQSFTHRELKVLLSLIDKHKTIILNKCTGTIINQRKEIVWKKICKEYNKRLKRPRSVDCLKAKWMNIKWEGKKLVQNHEYERIDDVMSQVVVLISEIKEYPITKERLSESEEEMDEKPDKNVFTKPCESDKESEEDGDDEGTGSNGHNYRSSHFSPQECALLLRCVKREKAHSFLKTKIDGANWVFDWNRITNAYNKVSPKKRTKQVLREKFITLKNLSKQTNHRIQNEPLKLKEAVTIEVIKTEPAIEFEVSDIENDKIDIDEEFIDDTLSDRDGNLDDPLNTVLHNDSGVGWINPFEDRQMESMKQELLKYKMETARLERKRVEDLIKADTAYRESKQIEIALRLRTARLEALAAASKLPKSDPALKFTAEEAPAQDYLDRYHVS